MYFISHIGRSKLQWPRNKTQKRILSRLGFIKLISLSLAYIRMIITTVATMLSGRLTRQNLYN